MVIMAADTGSACKRFDIDSVAPRNPDTCAVNFELSSVSTAVNSGLS